MKCDYEALKSLKGEFSREFDRFISSFYEIIESGNKIINTTVWNTETRNTYEYLLNDIIKNYVTASALGQNICDHLDYVANNYEKVDRGIIN